MSHLNFILDIDLNTTLKTSLTSSFTNWLPPGALHSLGWTLLHFLWQGAAIAALAAILMTLCRSAPSRYGLAVGALALMLAAPVTTFLILTSSPETFSSTPATSSSSSSVTSLTANYSSSARASRASVAPNTSLKAGLRTSLKGLPGTLFVSVFSRLSPSLNTLPWLVQVWLLGVAFFSLRSAGGFLVLERERRKQSNTPGARVLAMCQALQRRLGLERTIRYCECQWLQAPAVIGWFRPIVLLPVTALARLSEEQLQAIIVHELAHIQRLDPFVNIFQIVVETLLFYHPAVWWLNKRIRAEREHCCDDVAISFCGNAVEYARALTLMEEWRSAPVLAMAANRGPLSERVFRVLGMKPSSIGSRNLGLTGGILCLTGALFAGNALLASAYPKPIPHASAAPSRAAAAQSAPTPPDGVAAPSAKSSPVRPPAAEPQPAPTPASRGSYIDSMKAAGLGDLTVDQLFAMKSQGITPEYVRGLHDQGLHPDVDDLVSMRIQGVSPEYIRALRDLDLKPDGEQIVAMRIQGVDVTFIRGLRDAGIPADIDQLIEMKIQGVTPEYVRGIREQGLQPGADKLVAMRIQGVSPDYVREICAFGLKPTVDEFLSLRIQGVTPDYIKGLQDAGYKLTVDELVGAKIQGITPEFIERARKHGFQNVPLDELIHLKQMGILDSPSDI